MEINKVTIDPPEASFDLRLTATEAEQLVGLIDLAVKAGGIRIAHVSLNFVRRIQEGLQSAIVPASAASPVLSK